MITQREYEARTREEWRGTRVKSLVPLRNGLAKMPKGTPFTVTDKRGGFSLATDPCPTCGIQFYITKVSPRYLEYDFTIYSDSKERRTE